MSSSFGSNLKITIFGESHAKGIGMVIDGLPAGTPIDINKIQEALKNRRMDESLSTARKEPDEVNFICGVFNGFATGAPLAFVIENKDIDSSSYTEGEIRPGHADLTNYLKYAGYNNYRGGGFSSGRITASIVVLGEICKSLLEKYDVKIATRISQIYDKIESSSSWSDDLFKDVDKLLSNKTFPTLTDDAAKEMKEVIADAKESADSVGGSLETVILNAPIGLGEPYFESLESYISHLIFSIGGVKGVTFGNCDNMMRYKGSEFNDSLEIKDNKVFFKSQNAAGINGGLSNGEPIFFTTYIRPTASIGLKQKSIDVKKLENIDLEIKGRHDSCIVPRIIPVLNSLVAYAIVDLLMAKESKNI